MIATDKLTFDGLINIIELDGVVESITVVAIVDVFESATTLIELLDMLSQYSDITIGVKSGDTDKLISVSMVDSIDEINTPRLSLNILYPSSMMSDYNTGLTLRYIVDLYRVGSDVRLFRGVYSASEVMDLMLREGEYSILIWSDYTYDLMSDLHYNTSDLHSVKILSIDQYWANSDYRDAFAHSSEIDIIDGDNSLNISLYRPVAKFEIVATDVERYNLGVESGKYPPLLELSIDVNYDSYLPTGFNVESEKLFSVDLGYSFISSVSALSDDSATLAKDFILATRDVSSSVDLSLTFKDADGDIVSSCSGVTVSYTNGFVTTVEGDFLTRSDDFSIDTNWGGEFNIEF